MDKRWNPKAGRYGAHPVFCWSGIIGTGGLNLTPNNTTTFRIPTPFRRAWIERLFISAGGIASDADGTILATIQKRDNVAAGDVALTAATSLESDFITTANKVYGVSLLASLTDAQRILQEGDQLFASIVSNSAAIDTQPTHTAIGAELCILD